MMKHTLNRLLAWALMLALCGAMVPAGLAEGLEGPVEELVAFELPLEGDEAPVEDESIVEDEYIAEDEYTVVDEYIVQDSVTVEADDLSVDDEAPTPEAEDAAPSDDEALDDAEMLAAAQDVSGLRLNAASLVLGVKETYALAAALDGTSVTGVKYTSSDPKVAAVTAAGKITAKKAGNATVTAALGDMTAACAVEVKKAPTQVTLNITKAVPGAGEQLRLVATIPEGTASAITYKTSNAKVATVDANGLVTAVAKGTATITAAACNGKKATCKLTVKPAPTSIALAQTAVTLSVGQKLTPKVTLTGGAEEYALSSDGGAVTVSGTTIAAARTGSATVTAYTYNGLKAMMRVTVVAAPTSVKFDKSLYEIGVKDTVALKPVFDADVPADLTYTSSDAKTAAVGADGVVTGKKAGRVTISVATHNGLTASCQVQVYKAPTKVTMSQTALSLYAGETAQLEGKLPENSISTLTWTSDHPEIASVSAEGLVTAVAKGTAKITVATANNKKATCKVKVSAVPKSLTLSATELYIINGSSGTLTYALDTGEGEVSVAVADPTIAQITTVKNGKVTLKAKAAGETTITASAYGGLTATCKLVVTPKPTYLRLSEAATTLGVGQEYTIQTFTDAGGAAALKFTSSKAAVATVSAAGVVTGVKAGTATITVKTANNISAKLKVTVAKAPTSISLSPTSVTLEPYDYQALTVTLTKNTAAAVTFMSDDPSVAFVSEDGVITGLDGGTATVTATTSNGLTAACRVTVVVPNRPPEKPESVSLKTVNANTLQVAWTAVPRASGYRVYLGPSADPDDATLYGDYAADETGATLRGVGAGGVWHVFVTAYNAYGETDLSAAAHTMAKTPSSFTGYFVSLNYTGGIMLSAGDTKTLVATVSPSGYSGGIRWASNSGAVTLASQGGTACTINAARPGSTQVTVELDNGMSAALYVQVVDATDVSDENFNSVKKAILKNEALMNEDEGGNVIWDMIAKKLTDSNILSGNAQVIVDKVKTAESLFRDIYVYGLGTYDIQGEATRDKKGYALGTSQFLMRDDTLYLTKSTASANNYAYTALHETGHAVDYNGSEGAELTSKTDEATGVIYDDVRAMLTDRIGDAESAAGVSLSSASRSKVVEALLDYRTLLNEDAVLGKLTAAERTVYDKLAQVMTAEMNATLPKNNGTMVWDAIEGATNFAVSGSYGHAYLFNMSQYKEQANYYYYDRSGSPSITAEPWAEYFSANIMQDAATIAVNLAYLPKTCQYFADVVAPKVLDYLKTIVKRK